MCYNYFLRKYRFSIDQLRNPSVTIADREQKCAQKFYLSYLSAKGEGEVYVREAPPLFDSPSASSPSKEGRKHYGRRGFAFTYFRL